MRLFETAATRASFLCVAGVGLNVGRIGRGPRQRDVVAEAGVGLGHTTPIRSPATSIANEVSAWRSFGQVRPSLCATHRHLRSKPAARRWVHERVWALARCHSLIDGNFMPRLAGAASGDPRSMATQWVGSCECANATEGICKQSTARPRALVEMTVWAEKPRVMAVSLFRNGVSAAQSRTVGEGGRWRERRPQALCSLRSGPLKRPPGAGAYFMLT